jgi:hypothetical protein
MNSNDYVQIKASIRCASEARALVGKIPPISCQLCTIPYTQHSKLDDIV